MRPRTRLAKAVSPSTGRQLPRGLATLGGAVSVRPASGRLRAGGRGLAVGPDDVVRIRLAWGRPARQRPLHRFRQPLTLGALALRGAFREPGQDLGGEQLEALADVLVTVRAGLRDEDHLVDAGRLVALDQVRDLVRGPDRPAQASQPLLEEPDAERRVVGRDDLPCEADLRATVLELPPHVGAARPVLAEGVVVGKGEAEEVGAVDAALDRRRLVAVAHHRQHHGHVGVDGEARRQAALGLDQLVVGVHPLLRRLGLDEGERQGPKPPLRSHQDRVPPAAGHPERRVGLLLRLRDDVSGRHRDPAPLVAGERLLHEHAGDRVQRLLPLGSLLLAIDAEPPQLHLRAALAGPELHPATGDQVERRHPLGHPRGVVDGRGGLNDPVSEADAARALAGGGQEDLRGARVRVLLQEVVLDLPDVVDPQPVGQLHLLERVGQQLGFVGLAFGAGELVLVEEAEPHLALTARGYSDDGDCVGDHRGDGRGCLGGAPLRRTGRDRGAPGAALRALRGAAANHLLQPRPGRVRRGRRPGDRARATWRWRLRHWSPGWWPRGCWASDAPRWAP